MRSCGQPRLYPACTLAVIVNAIGIVCAIEGISLLHLFPVRVQEIHIVGGPDIVVDRHDEQRGRVGSGIFVAEFRPVELTVQHSRSQRKLMHHLAVGTLPLRKKLQGLLRQILVAVAVHRIEAPQGVAAKVPSKPRPSGIKRRIPTCNEPCFIASTHFILLNSNLRPSQRGIEARIRRVDCQSMVEKVIIVGACLTIYLRQGIGGRDNPRLHCRYRRRRILFSGPADLRYERKEAALVLLRVEMYLELKRQRLRALLIWSHDSW